MRKLLFRLMRPRKQWLWHPESPGVKVLVVRTWLGRLLRSRYFAGLTEQTYRDQPALPPLYVDPKTFSTIDEEKANGGG